MSGSETGITTTAKVWNSLGTLAENGEICTRFVWKDGVKLSGIHYTTQAIHQESDVIPENVDAIRALTGIEEDWRKSVAKTDEAIARYNHIWMSILQ